MWQNLNSADVEIIPDILMDGRLVSELKLLSGMRAIIQRVTFLALYCINYFIYFDLI